MKKVKPKVGPPFKAPELVKVPITVKLPKWLVAWMHKHSDQQGISRAVMIEQALTEKHGIEPPKPKQK